MALRLFKNIFDKLIYAYVHTQALKNNPCYRPQLGHQPILKLVALLMSDYLSAE